VWLGLVLAHGLLPLALIYAFGHLIGVVPTAARVGLDSAAGREFLLAVGAVGAVLLAEQLVESTANAFDQILGRRLDGSLQQRVIVATNQPTDIAHLEDPRINESIGLARSIETAVHPPSTAVRAIHVIVTNAVTGMGAAVILAGFRWWAPFAIAIGWTLQDLWGHQQHDTLESRQRQMTEMRRYEYLRSLGFDRSAAKEVRIFGLAGWLASRAEAHWRESMANVWRRRRVSRFLVVAIAVSQLAANAIVLMTIVTAGTSGEISVASVAIYLQAMLSPFVNLLQPYNMMVLRNATPAIVHALRLKERIGSEPISRRAAARGLPAREIHFANVSFGYPGTGRQVLKELDLRIPAGRSLAIVGENGAGKTTIVKLLTGLYAPDEGHLTADGVDVRDLEPDSWRSRIAVIFQDFVEYPFSLRENIAFGALSHAEDESSIARAATAAGLARLPDALARGWDTPLAPEFGGVGLSGGQWQRVALARALFAVQSGAAVLVLDEPTANLDVRGEAAFFDRFLELTEGLTTILISHRFSTVRHADRICVIEDGALQEVGSHDELVAQGGHYAAMFELQASQFEPNETASG
jgi:ATP-binding cassette subfamily B protein